MEQTRLKEEKSRFGEQYRKGDFAAAAETAARIMREFPDSPSGYYYALVLETKNFRVAGDREKTAALYARFAERADKTLAEKYGGLLDGLNGAKKEPVKKSAAAPVAAKKRFSLSGLLLSLIALLFAAAWALSFGSFKTFSEPDTFYQTAKWQENMYDTVVFKLTLNEEDGEITDNCLVDGVWVNIGGIDRASTASSASITVSSATSASNSFSTGFGGGAKTVPNTFDSVGKWIRLSQSTSTSTVSPRVYYQLATKSELKYNEVMFLDRNGKKIAAEVVYAGPNENPNAKLGDLIKSELYADRIAAAAKTLDEQDKFLLSAVNGGTYERENYTGMLTEREAAVLDSVRNILSGENGYTEETSNAFGLQLIAAGVAVFGGNAFGLRFVPMLFTLGTIVLMYFFAKRLFGSERAGLAAALLFAAGGYALSAATLGATEAIFVFFALLSVHFIAEFYKNAGKANKRAYAYLALSGAGYALAVSVKTQGIFLLVGLAAVFCFALYRQYKAAKARGVGNAAAAARTRSLFVVVFLAAFILGAAVWTALTFLFSYNVYFVESGLSAGAFLQRFFAAPFTEISTKYAAHNASNVLGWLISHQAEQLSSAKFFFGNTVLSLLALFSFIYSTVYVIYAYISKSEYKSDFFKKQVVLPYFVLTAAFLSAWIYAAFAPQAFVSGFSAASVFYYAFIVLAARLLVSQENKTVTLMGEKAGVSTAVYAAIVLFAVVLGVFSYAKYAGIALAQYPLDFASMRW